MRRHRKVQQCAECGKWRDRVFLIKIGHIVPHWACREHWRWGSAKARERTMRDEDEIVVFRADLEAEVERLRAENAAMRHIVEAVAPGVTIYFSLYEGTFCVLCNGYVPGNVNVAEYDLMQFPHKPECLVVQARAFIAAHPATGTAAGEAESAGGDDE